MNITYSTTQSFSPEQLQTLFLSVGWSSGKYPDKLTQAMKNSGAVFTAWDGDELVGLINVLDDKVMTAYVHFLLIAPAYQGKGIGKELIGMVKEKYKDYLRLFLISDEKETGFYENNGFEIGKRCVPMFINKISLDT